MNLVKTRKCIIAHVLFKQTVFVCCELFEDHNYEIYVEIPGKSVFYFQVKYTFILDMACGGPMYTIVS